MVKFTTTRPVGSSWVIVPTYNEVQNVARLIDAVLEQGDRFAVLVVDDGSPDGTADAAIALRSLYGDRVRVLRRAKKRGYGRVLSGVANRIARLVAGLPVRDCTGGFRGYRIETVRYLTEQRIDSTTYTFLVETLF